MSSSSKSYLIVGAGVFGVSAAYHLIKKYPDANVTIVDRDAYDADSRVAASWDWNKVIRADYDDIIYCKLALEAQDILETDELWKPYFHQTGIYWACRSDYADDVVNNYKKLGRKADLKAVPVSEARKLYNGLFDDADYTDVKSVLVNKTSGWVAAGDCLRAITKKCLELGVKYVVADVQSLQIDGSGRCYGLSTTSGNTLKADHIILSTGAFTPKLLEWSAAATGRDELRSGDRILAGGITTGMTKLDQKTLPTYKDMPVGVQGYTAATGTFIGSLPPTPDGELKWWGQTIFSHTHEVMPGRHLSAPPNEPHYGQWNVSNKLKRDIAYANNVFYGKKTANWKMEKYRICWDAFTTSADFIISPHSGAKGLYVATCGNFHGWKFFPVLGKYITQMLEGELAPELADKWAWDRERPDPVDNPDWPRAEYKNLLDPIREARL
ncbi:L-pipecolate oxidase-like protein 3 [Elsinoe australis]|uniref:L-pipecolate oxidase-like protein 3 n=1 Tax=Elsinoe australis TaxID=40998 RepID=A0A4U7ARP4_9PEZI|nr:L-pipecolate oxidase-like protein 3 [Elsinoe australis]